MPRFLVGGKAQEVLKIEISCMQGFCSSLSHDVRSFVLFDEHTFASMSSGSQGAKTESKGTLLAKYESTEPLLVESIIGEI